VSDSIVMIHVGLCGVYLSEIPYLNAAEYFTCSQKSQKYYHLVSNDCLMVKDTVKVIEWNKVELFHYK